MTKSIFDDSIETSSLFEEVKPEETQSVLTGSIFEDEPEEPLDSDKEIEEDADPTNISLFSEDDSDDSEEDTPAPKKPGRKPKFSEEVTPYGQAIKTLIKEVDDFLIYEGEGEEDRDNYTEVEFVDLIKQNIDTKVEEYVESTLKQIVESFSPSIQKIITAELKGVKVKDLIEDIREYEELESLPSNPNPVEKENIVKKFYKELGKERGKSDEWVNKQVERIVDNNDLDEEYNDAVKHFEEKISAKIQAKEAAKERELQQKIAFKQHHAHIVNEVLKDDEIFGIPLKKQDKQVIANVLAGFTVRNTDKKEKLNLTAIIDQLIHDKKNPKESYQTLALMSLAGVNPKGMIEALKNSTETKITQDTVKKLKVADKKQVTLQDKKIVPSKKSSSFF